MVAGTVVDIDDLNVRVGFGHAVQETVATVDAGAAGLVVHQHGNLAFATNQFGHLIGGQGGGGNVVRRSGGNRDVAIDTGVEADDRDALGLGFFQQRNGGLRVKRRKADGSRVLGQSSSQHLDLLVNLGLGRRAFEGDVDIQVGSSLLGAELHSLPELVLETLGNDRDVGLCRSIATGSLGRRRFGRGRFFATGRCGRRHGRRTRADHGRDEQQAQQQQYNSLVLHGLSPLETWN